MTLNTNSRMQEPAPLHSQRVEIPLVELVPNDANRKIVEDDDFAELVDSLRVFGVLEPLKIRLRADGRYDLLDGHRRHAAAQRAHLAVLPCDIWPADLASAEAIARALVLNHHRKQPGCLDTARQLRRLKNEFAITQDQLAARTCLSLDRVRLYLSLFGASDHLLSFFEDTSLPLLLAVEFMRFEKATNEAAARRLAKRHLEAPLTTREVARLRKREDSRSSDLESEPAGTKTASRPAGFRGRIEAAFRRDASGALQELEAALGALGYRLVRASE